MSRRANAKPACVQMFPFLAVLICTMGALVVLLHAFARYGQVQAMQIAEAEVKAREMTVDDFQWRIGHLRTARAKTEAELADERLKLAHVEDHHRRLQEKLRKLKLAAAEMERSGEETTGHSRTSTAELAATKVQSEEARAAVDAARREGRLTGSNFDAIEKLEPWARDLGHSLLELAFAWLLAVPEVSSVIAGASNPEQLAQNAAACEWALTAEEKAEVDGMLGG